MVRGPTDVQVADHGCSSDSRGLLVRETRFGRDGHAKNELVSSVRLCLIIVWTGGACPMRCQCALGAWLASGSAGGATRRVG